ncbi:hypothetical protein EYF80_023982 [Liparis tanakae]|uniref:Uncharacterized protein n=1 Tax=Liparis tanakae TaxID=230148 RepID=A0A4Z2HJR7_9TELE|nr:hypothetical protein EYF80_023982 [Liparis tanakae]
MPQSEPLHRAPRRRSISTDSNACLQLCVHAGCGLSNEACLEKERREGVQMTPFTTSMHLPAHGALTNCGFSNPRLRTEDVGSQPRGDDDNNNSNNNNSAEAPCVASVVRNIRGFSSADCEGSELFRRDFSKSSHQNSPLGFCERTVASQHKTGLPSPRAPFGSSALLSGGRKQQQEKLKSDCALARKENIEFKEEIKFLENELQGEFALE